MNTYKKKVLIYNDNGVFDISNLKNSLKNHFIKHDVSVDTINARELLAKQKLNNEEVVAFFMPGGIANEYYKKLFGEGNKIIQDYVNLGGTYFGICAGAYYACKNVEFETEIPESRLSMNYGLDLVNGVARGTMYKEFDILPFSKRPESVAVVKLKGKKLMSNYAAIYHGGPFFDEFGEDCKVLANYCCDSKNEYPAIMSLPYGDGNVILSGVHFETGADDLETLKPYLYKNKSYMELLKNLKKGEKARKKLFKSLMTKIM